MNGHDDNGTCRVGGGKGGGGGKGRGGGGGEGGGGKDVERGRKDERKSGGAEARGRKRLPPAGQNEVAESREGRKKGNSGQVSWLDVNMKHKFAKAGSEDSGREGYG